MNKTIPMMAIIRNGSRNEAKIFKNSRISLWFGVTCGFLTLKTAMKTSRILNGLIKAAKIRWWTHRRTLNFCCFFSQSWRVFHDFWSFFWQKKRKIMLNFDWTNQTENFGSTQRILKRKRFSSYTQQYYGSPKRNLRCSLVICEWKWIKGKLKTSNGIIIPYDGV